MYYSTTTAGSHFTFCLRLREQTPKKIKVPSPFYKVRSELNVSVGFKE